MGTNCAPLEADLFLFCYERDFMTSLSDDNQADIIKAFNSTSRYLDDLLNIDNPYFEGMVNQIYPPELQLNKANTSDTKAPLLDLHLWGPPGVLGIWGEGLFIFRELGSTANYLRGAGEQAHTFGDLGSTAKK